MPQRKMWQGNWAARTGGWGATLHRTVRDGLSEKLPFVPRQRGHTIGISGERCPGREISECKGPGAKYLRC